ncbi:glycoside hydrolase family 16 protein [Paractinoplanes durhamensis]|uniref:glycoside hydrolase family 16 protein n=1 Tax=Paractinoplanes durhamensis TaxID=113563 RepID=UPI0036342685
MAAVALVVRDEPAGVPAVAAPSTPAVEPTTTAPVTHSSDEAAARHGWGEPVASQSDEYNGTSVDLDKWGLFGVDAGESAGCSAGYHAHGRRCASQTTVAGGYLSVTGTADGKTGGLWGRMTPFRYGRVEVRERAVALTANGGKAYHAVPLIWPEIEEDWEDAEIDFAERDVGAKSVSLYVHHEGTQNCSSAVDSTKFHNYAVDWQPNTITWYVDGKLICTVKATIDSFSRSNGGAQMDMFPADGTLMRPARQDIDWVRMYATAATEYQPQA